VQIENFVCLFVEMQTKHIQIFIIIYENCMSKDGLVDDTSPTHK